MTMHRRSPAAQLRRTRSSPASDGAIVRAKGLKTHFPVKSRGLLPRTIGYVKAVDGIDLTINAGETLGLVGEIRLGQDDCRALDPDARQADGRHHRARRR